MDKKQNDELMDTAEALENAVSRLKADDSNLAVLHMRAEGETEAEELMLLMVRGQEWQLMFEGFVRGLASGGILHCVRFDKPSKPSSDEPVVN